MDGWVDGYGCVDGAADSTGDFSAVIEQSRSPNGWHTLSYATISSCLSVSFALFTALPVIHSSINSHITHSQAITYTPNGAFNDSSTAAAAGYSWPLRHTIWPGTGRRRMDSFIHGIHVAIVHISIGTIHYIRNSLANCTRRKLKGRKMIH